MSKVELYVYDLSKGMARAYGPMLGLDIEGVWHSAIVAHGKEIYFGPGIFVHDAGKTHLGRPDRVVTLGDTEVPEDLMLDYVDELREEWRAEGYDLFERNCNHFSNELAQFLSGNEIPAYITDTATKVKSTPLGRMLAAQLGADGGAALVP